jgi:hypothetical protein
LFLLGRDAIVWPLKTAKTGQAMTPSPYIALARPYLAPGARLQAWADRARCKVIVARLQEDGENALADQLEKAMRRPHLWLGMSAHS